MCHGTMTQTNMVICLHGQILCTVGIAMYVDLFMLIQCAFGGRRDRERERWKSEDTKVIQALMVHILERESNRQYSEYEQQYYFIALKLAKRLDLSYSDNEKETIIM